MLFISKKNGKSVDAAAIMLTALVRNWRMSGEFLILAPNARGGKQLVQAGERHDRGGPRRAGAASHPAALEDDHAPDDRGLAQGHRGGQRDDSGKKAIGVFVDELWLFGKRANAENMLREATGGLVSRPEGFVIYATTQSDEPPAGVFRQKLHYFRGVRDGTIVDPKSLGVL